MAVAERAPATAPIVGAMWHRAMLEVLRTQGQIVATTMAPLIFVLGIAGQFDRLSDLRGFPTDNFLSWTVILGCMQAAGFAGAAAGVNLARDIETGWFDRMLVSPAPRWVLLIGPLAGAASRSVIPASFVLGVGFLAGAELPGGPDSLIFFYIAVVGYAGAAAVFGMAVALFARTQQAGPLMQMTVFAGVFVSTAYTPQPLLRGWLADAAAINPVTHVLEMGRQGLVSGIGVSWAHTWPGLVALAGIIAGAWLLVMVGLARLGR
jgi:ABC-2 type transport system permease protein